MRSESIFCNPYVVRKLSRIHENFVIVPAEITSNNYIFFCQKHNVDILIEEFWLHSRPGNLTYNLTDFSASEVLDNHKSVLTSKYGHIMRSSICLTFIGFRKCTKIPINTDSFLVHRSVRPSLHPFYLQNCLYIVSKVFRSTVKQPSQEVGSIRWGS